MPSSRWSLLAVVLSATAVAMAQATTQAAPVGDGPLVVLRTGSPLDNGGATVWSVAELDGKGPAQPFWRSKDNCDVLARLDRDHLLLASYGAPYALVVVDLAHGRHTVLVDGAPHEFVAVHGDDVLHLGDRRVHDSSVRLRPDEFFFATPWRSPEQRRRVCEVPCERIAKVAGNLAILITEGERSVHATSLTSGTTRLLWTVPEGASHLCVSLSPGGQRLALGAVAKNGKGLLTVVDVATSRVMHQWPDLPIDVSPFSSNRPKLEVGWHDEEHVVCSETRRTAFTFVRRHIERDEVVDEEPYGPVELWHRAPPPPTSAAAAATKPFFRAEEIDGTTQLLALGSKEPLRTWQRPKLPPNTLSFAPSGNAVVVHDARANPPCHLLTEAVPAGRTLAYGEPYAIVWLPAVSARSPQAPR